MPAATLQALWPDDLGTAAQAVTRWIWHGYVGAGCVTLLTSQWKSGKTTLLSLLLSKRVQGGSLAGLAVESGKSAIVSEESVALWNGRRLSLDFGQHSCFFCRPFPAKPTALEWHGLLDALHEQVREHAIDLIVVDTLASFLPSGAECSADLLMNTLMPLLNLAKLGCAVLLLHHPKKGCPPEGQAARGTGALSGFADIVLEMSHLGPPSAADRRRRLAGMSRFAQTSRQLLVQLNEAGSDYECLSQDFDECDFLGNWAHVERLLNSAQDKLTRQQIMAEWSPDVPKPADTSLWRWLDRAYARQMLARDGDGFRSSPYRYWLPHKLEEWMNDPIYQLHHMDDGVKMPWE